MTDFVHSIAVLTPQQHWQTTGALVACISNERADLTQFCVAKFQPDYAACNAQAKQAHVDAVLAAVAGQYTPARPAFDIDNQIDMVAVLELIDDMQVVTNIPDSGQITTVPGTLVIGINIDVRTLAAACNFAPVPEVSDG